MRLVIAMALLVVGGCSKVDAATDGIDLTETVTAIAPDDVLSLCQAVTISAQLRPDSDQVKRIQSRIKDEVFRVENKLRRRGGELADCSELAMVASSTCSLAAGPISNEYPWNLITQSNEMRFYGEDLDMQRELCKSVDGIWRTVGTVQP
jgi:hypothetical protein